MNLFELDVGIMGSMLLDGFNFESGESSQLRTGQFLGLYQGWVDGNLFFGAGNGAALNSVVRDIDMPWAYELTYSYLLYSTGLVGSSCYFAWFGWGVLRLRNALLISPEMGFLVGPIMSGVFGLGIAAASNPYFGKFDYLWIILLPHLIAGGIRFQKFEHAPLVRN